MFCSTRILISWSIFFFFLWILFLFLSETRSQVLCLYLSMNLNNCLHLIIFWNRSSVRLWLETNFVTPFNNDFAFSSKIRFLIILHWYWNTSFIQLKISIQLRIYKSISENIFISCVCGLNYITRDYFPIIINFFPCHCFWAFSFLVKSFFKICKLMDKWRAYL